MIGHLKFEPAGRLVAGAVAEGPPQSLVTVGRVAGRAFADEAAQVLDEVLRGREAADTERQQDPAARVRRFGGVVGQLLTDLTVDLVPGQKHRRWSAEVNCAAARVLFMASTLYWKVLFWPTKTVYRSSCIRYRVRS